MARRKTAGGLSKADEIRAEFKKDPTIATKDVMSNLQGRGISVTSAHVSNVKSKLGLAPRRRRRRRGRPRKAEALAMIQSSESITVGALVQAKRFAEAIGGVDVAKRAISALSRLQ